jgi:hypothetical protein
MSNNNKSKNIVKKAKNLLESFGVKNIESALENKDIEYGSVLKFNTKTNLGRKKYLKPCKDDEDPYNTTPPKPTEIKIKRVDNDGKLKKISSKTLVSNSGFGLVIPFLSILDMDVLVPKQKKLKCFRKSRKKISNESVDLGGVCYKHENCKSKKCENNFFGLFEGNCVARRPNVNIEEGGLCASNDECKEDLYCNNWYIGLGQCKKSKTKKKDKNLISKKISK